MVRVIASILVLAMYSLKMVDWGVIVGSHPTITPILTFWMGEMHEHAIALHGWSPSIDQSAY